MNTLVEKIKSCRHRKLMYLVCYTLFFLLCATAAFFMFILCGKSFIWSGDTGDIDGISQHYVALSYYGTYLRQIFRTFLSTGKLSIPLFDTSIGLGGDIISTLSYYVIGDPLTVLSALVPRAYTEYLFNFLAVFRLYLAGLAFSAFAAHLKKGNRFYTLLSSMIYVFCGYVFFAIRHPYFYNPMIYLPLILLGAEYIFEKEKPFLFIISIALSALSNFYFFYMICLLTVIYAVVRVFDYAPKGQRKKILSYLWRFALYAGLGVMMASVLFYPAARAILSSARGATGPTLSPLYSFGYYKAFFYNLLTPNSIGSWTCNGMLPISLVAVAVMWLTPHKGRSRKILYAAATAVLLLPICGWVLNGTAYVSNRWIWGYALLVGIICVFELPHLADLSAKEWCKLLAFCTIYAAVGITLEMSGTYLTGIILLLVSVTAGMTILLSSRSAAKRARFFRIAAAVLVVVQIAVFGNQRYNINDYVSEFQNHGTAYQFVRQAQAQPLTDLNDTSFYRYEDYFGVRSRQRNATLINGGNSTNYYFSLPNGYWYDLLRSVGHVDGLSQDAHGTDQRAVISTLANVKYLTGPLSKNGAFLPYGYNTEPFLTAKLPDSRANRAQTQKSFFKDITYGYYRNLNALPFGYTYDSYLTEEEYDTLSFTQKQNALLHSAVIDTDSTLPHAALPENTDRELSYTLQYDPKKVEVSGLTFQTYEKNQTVEFVVSGAADDTETYFEVIGARFEQQDAVTLSKMQGEWEYLSSQQQSDLRKKVPGHTTPNVIPKVTAGKNMKSFHIFSKTYTYYPGDLDYSINLGCHDASLQKITLTLPSAGKYTFDTIRIVQLPMQDFAEQTKALGAEHLDNVVFGTNTVSGDITVEKNKLLCISLPYSEGWTATVDGKPTDIVKTDLAFLGLELTAGTHTVTLNYFSPYLLFGILISAVGWGIFILWLLIDFIIKKRKDKK